MSFDNRSKKKFSAAYYPRKFIQSAICNFTDDKIETINNEYIVSPGFSETAKPFMDSIFPFCTKNVPLKQFIKRSHYFTEIKSNLWIKLLIENSVQCNRVHNCGETYIKERVKNKETRWSEHQIPSAKSNPSKYLNNNTTHCFNCTVIFNSPAKKFQLKF